MMLTPRQTAKLNKILALVQELLDQSSKAAKPSKKAGRAVAKPTRTRRSSSDVVKMRADILAKRAKGVSAAALAEKYGVSTAYIYMIKP